MVENHNRIYHSQPHNYQAPFVELFHRVKGMWDEWQRREEEHVVVFCHSMFIYAFDLSLRLNFSVPGPRTMGIFRGISSGIAVPNGGILKCRIDDSGEVWVTHS